MLVLIAANVFQLTQAIETTDDAWTACTQIPMDSGLTARATVVARLTSTGETRHWSGVVGASGGGLADGTALSLVLSVPPFSSGTPGNALESADIRVRSDGEYAVLEVRGLLGQSIGWACDLSGVALSAQ